MDDENNTTASVATVEAAYVELETPVDLAEGKSEAVPPTLNASTPVKLEEVEFLKHQLLLSKVQKAQLLQGMYHRELARAEAELNEQGHQLGQHARALAEKYSVDLRFMIVSDDGYFMPRPQQ